MDRADHRRHNPHPTIHLSGRLKRINVNHAQLSACVDAALQIERNPTAIAWPAKDRWAWLTEVELASRIRSELVVHGIPADQVRMNAQGRVAQGGTNYDIEIGCPVSSAVEVVYGCTGGPSPVPASGIDRDLAWLTQAAGRHAVLFLPTLVEGYRVQKNPAPFDLSGNYFNPAANELLLTDALQVGGLSALSFHLLTGVVAQVANPARGTSRRWTVVGAPTVLPMLVGADVVDVSVIGSPSDRLWAIVWSRR